MDKYTDHMSNRKTEDKTGSHSFEEESQVITYPFGKYQIDVRVTLDGKFLGITQVSLNKDFLSHPQKMSSVRVHDIEEFYKEDE